MSENNHLHERIYLAWIFHEILRILKSIRKDCFYILHWIVCIDKNCVLCRKLTGRVCDKDTYSPANETGQICPKGRHICQNAWILKSRIQNSEFRYSFQSDCIVLGNSIDFWIVSKFCWLGKGSRSEAKLWWKNKHRSVSVAPPLIEARLS